VILGASAAEQLGKLWSERSRCQRKDNNSFTNLDETHPSSVPVGLIPLLPERLA
jgi:hypothetical protein